MDLFSVMRSFSAEDTEAIGKKIAEAILNDKALPRFIALYGDLGVGKTAFTRGFTSAIAPTARVKSPTFALVNQYKGDSISVFHFDMYRITDSDDLYSIGYDDYVEREGYCIVEWSENIEDMLPEGAITVSISRTESETVRRIEVEYDNLSL